MAKDRDRDKDLTDEADISIKSPPKAKIKIISRAGEMIFEGFLTVNDTTVAAMRLRGVQDPAAQVLFDLEQAINAHTPYRCHISLE